jgi:phage terminase Nu1 subunit (DNA packaging protein)
MTGSRTVKKSAGGTAEEKNKKPAPPKQAALIAVPEFASSTAIAQMIGKTTRRVQQLTQDGVLQTEIPPGGGNRKYKTCETIQAYIAYIEKKAQENSDGSRVLELQMKKLEAEIELKESQGQLHKLKTAIAEGKYISAEQSTEDLTDFLMTLKKFLASIPGRIGRTIIPFSDTATARAAEKAIRNEIDDMLTIFVDGAIPEEGGGENEEI